VDTAHNELHSPWLAAAGPEPRPRLNEGLDVDAAVIGGGIVGVSAAHHLAEAGLSVALLEARTVASGVTGNSTAKLTALQGTVYSQIRGKHGDEAARAYADLNRAGVEEAFAIAERHGIECRIERRPAYTHAEREENRSEVEDEVDAAGAAGLDVEYTEETDLPYGVAAAVRLDEQGQFDPAAWCRGVAGEIAARGVQVFEHTRARGVRTRNGAVWVETEPGAEVRCETLVCATHMPFLDRGLYFARVGPKRSYAVAGPVGAPGPRGMYLSVESPTRSIRSFVDTDGSDHVIVGGEGHKTGHSNPVDHYRSLEHDLLARHGADAVDYRWAAHDLVPVDSLPFIGRLTPFDDRILTATGFAKWGLAAGIAAGGVLSDLAVGKPNPFAEAFDPARLNLRAALPELVKERADDAFRFFFDRLKRRPGADPAPGEGLIAGSGLEQHAVYREEGGKLHRLSARCTHLGCIVAWNPVEHTWDCPCHGSRYGATGEVLQGPAVDPLRPKD
jgi:glycine/D-amino acid oxidase-like deaminating enzyme/nitrite reductase/ring-hydroxylating ferredoxin subunit